MPCKDDGWEQEENQNIRDRFDKMTRIACKALTHIEESGDGLEILILRDPEIAEWWSKHKELDRKRKEQLRREQEIESIRQGALSKLSPEEKKVLGIR